MKRKLRLWGLCALLTCMAMAVQGGINADSARCALDRFAGDSTLRHASLTVAVSHIATGKVVASHNIDLACITASTMKTVTGATALRLLGPDYVFKTHVKLVGETKGSKFKGQVVVQGSGDPTLGSAYFASNANLVQEVLLALQARGIKKIEGEIVVDGSLIPFPPYNSWWGVDDLAWNYGMGIHGLNYHDNRVKLSFDVPMAGQVSHVCFTPPVPGLGYVNRLDTVNHDNVDLYLEYGTPAVVLAGSAKVGEHYGMTIANPLPQSMLADSLARTLQAHDVKLKIKPQVLSKLQQVDTILLVEHHSPPLQEIIASLLDRSDNMFTEGLLRAIAHQQGRQATASQGVAVVDSLWRASGLDTSPLFQRDGSGLARANKCSARFLTEMLNYMASHPCEGTTLSQLMPTAGRRIGPLLENHGMERDLVVKSGSMTGVQCFVGYYPAWLPQYSWAVLINDWNGSRTHLKDLISTLLIELFGSQKSAQNSL